MPADPFSAVTEVVLMMTSPRFMCGRAALSKRNVGKVSILASKSVAEEGRDKLGETDVGNDVGLESRFDVLHLYEGRQSWSAERREYSEKFLV